MKLLITFLLVILLIHSFGCNTKPPTDDTMPSTDAGPDWTPREIVCPGNENCEAGSQSELLVGVAVRKITPTNCETFTDLDGDFIYNKDDPYDDANNNGKFDACWLAGYDYSQPANDIRDDLWVHTIVIKQDNTKVALVVADLIGLFYDELELVRNKLDPKSEIDLVVLGSIHNHNAPDTLGLWGPMVDRTGINPQYQESIRTAIVDSIKEAAEALTPANITYAQIKTVDSNNSTEHYVSDKRDPIIIDPTLSTLRFTSTIDNKTIATIVNWALHPGSWGGERLSISSDFVYWLRKSIEEGTRGKEGIGGVTLFFNGALGGQIGPVKVTPLDANGQPVLGKEGKAQAIGESVAVLALQALSESEDTDTAPKLSFSSTQIKVKFENRFFTTAYLLGVLDRELVDFNKDEIITEKNLPSVISEIVSLHIGKAHLVTVPGEPHPELIIGYDKEHSYNWDQISTNNPNPPDLSKAPLGPYIKDLMTGNYNFVLGLTQDELGYIVPEFNFQLDPDLPYVLEPEGHHYEETRSVGPDGEKSIIGKIKDLLQKEK